MDPHQELDPLLFGPEVQGLFEETRRLTPVAEVGAGRTSFPPGDRGVPVRVRVNTPHVIVFTAEGVNGQVLDTVFRGRVRTKTTVYWDASGPPHERPHAGGSRRA